LTEQQGLQSFKDRIAAWPVWARLILLAAGAGLVALLSKWLILVLLIALGLWPIVLLLGLGVLAIISTRHGGWPWMKEWLAARLRQLAVPALSVIAALVIGGLLIMFTDHAAFEAIGEGHIGSGLGLTGYWVVRICTKGYMTGGIQLEGLKESHMTSITIA